MFNKFVRLCFISSKSKVNNMDIGLIQKNKKIWTFDVAQLTKQGDGTD